jgi:PmbA protein
VLRHVPAGGAADVRVVTQHWGTMRFATSRIHQPHIEQGREVSVRVALDQRIATATTTDLSVKGCAAVVAQAVSLARTAPREPAFKGFPRNSGTLHSTGYSSRTAGLSPEGQAKFAERVLEAAGAADESHRVSGAVNFGAFGLTVANTSGLLRSGRRSVCQASVLVERPGDDPPSSGWAEGAGWDARHVDPTALGREAVERMAKQQPQALPPGKYRVLLDYAAAGDLLLWLGMLGFGGHPEAEGWSCLRRRRGRRVAPEFVNVVDDASSPESIPIGIDFEGLAARRTPLIRNGVAGPAVVDIVTGGRLNRRPTGHALPPESPWGGLGPCPTHLVVGAGDATPQEMIRETKRGVWVTRFHYVRVVDPGKGVLTGMTRNGTYLIEKGEVKAPVRNLRFTESILTALEGIELVGRTRHRVSDERGMDVRTTPALVSRAFRFTSATLF